MSPTAQQHPYILTCLCHSPILSADKTTTTLYSHFLSAEKSFQPRFNLSPNPKTQTRDCYSAANTHKQHGTDYTASAERIISTVALLYFPPYDTNRSIRSRLPFIYTHQDPLYICGNLTQFIRSCCQHPCILTCHFHSPILSADRTTTTLYSPTLT